jgi:peptidoglycan/LPS O-acetylase OafA/YrhL
LEAPLLPAAGAETSPARGYLAQLDGLRAIAVLAVLLSHFGLGEDLKGVVKAVDWGRLGVRLFFVLSGFLITRILLAARASALRGVRTKGTVIRNFYIRRVLRIFPLFYFVLAVATVLDVGNIREIAAYHALYLSNLTSVIFVSQDPVVLRDPNSAHFWSLAVEEQFYLVWPAIIVFAPSYRIAFRLCVAGILFAPAWRAVWFLSGNSVDPLHLPACLDSLGAGAVLAFWYEDVDGVRSRLRRVVKPVLLGGALLFVVVLAWKASGIWYRPYAVLADGGIAVVMLMFVQRAAEGRKDRLGRCLEARWLLYLGRISYGIYVYHAFMGPLLAWIERTLGLALPAGSPVKAAVLVAMTIGVATVSWFVLERPLIRLKDRFASSSA